MFTLNNQLKLVVAVVAAVTLGDVTGCRGEPNTATAAAASTQPVPRAVTPADSYAANTTVVNHSLGASDGLGAMLILQESAQAAATAEAKVQDGSYDQWYASFERDPEAVREAKAQEPAGTNQTGTGTYVDVPIPEPVR